MNDMRDTKHGAVRTKSYDLRDYYRAWLKDKKRGWTKVKETTFTGILTDIFTSLFEKLMQGENVVFRGRMGMMTIQQREVNVTKTNGRYYSHDYIDWQKTKKLWEEHPEYYKKEFIYMGLKRYFYHHYKYDPRSGWNANLYYLLLSEKNNDRIFHELTLNEKNRVWQNNIFQ